MAYASNLTTGVNEPLKPQLQEEETPELGVPFGTSTDMLVQELPDHLLSEETAL